ATVFLADDLKHHRKVAIKVLHPELSASIGADRFLREIETAARLNHPHILPLYDSGAAGDRLYYVMPHVRGESLRQRLRREKQLDVDTAVGITREVASALDFAHAEAVVHRDVKPENILLHEGEALATRPASEGRLTRTGVTIGTPEYMSPEQALGDEVDARSDIYSLACVLYEMLAGEPPHAGHSARAIIARRLSDETPSVRRIRGAVPVAIDRALARALSREPNERFASAGAFARALTQPADTVERAPCVAVLPFVNLSADPENEYFADGITEDVIAQLSKIRSLPVISRTSIMQFKKRDQPLRDIGTALNATTILEGSVRRAGDRVRIVAQLIDADTDRHLWTETYDRQLTDIFAIQSDVALQIANALRAELSREERKRIGKEPTRDLEAYQLYLQGRHAFTRYTAEGMRNSLGYFERATERDPSFAMPYVGLALAHAELGETGVERAEDAYRRAKAAARTALELDGELGEAHCVMGYISFVSDFDWSGAEREFKRALELTPGNADTYGLYGRLCASLGRNDEAIEMQRRAHELDPVAFRADLATAFLRAGRPDEALRIALATIELDPTYARGHATAGWALFKKGEHEDAIAHLKTAVTLAPRDNAWLAQLGQAYAMAGDAAKAREVLRELEQRSRHAFVSPYHFAYVLTGLGEQDRAMDYLEQAFENRSGAIYGIKGSFLFASLQSHPRFTALLRKMNLA
ncbi:MAG: tetratricopeptide repeat protein, partial [Betaproteobacteria bacterium]